MATGAAIAAVSHHRAATVPVILLPVVIAKRTVPSFLRSMIVIAAAPDAAKYCSARFRFGGFASMGNVDSEIRGRRQNPGENPDFLSGQSSRATPDSRTVNDKESITQP
jgi:hypothetical protein